MSFFPGHGNCTWKWCLFIEEGSRGESHLQIMSLISKKTNHISEAQETWDVNISVNWLDWKWTCKVKWRKYPGKPDESAPPSFWTFPPSTLKNNCINTEKLLMWNCGRAKMKNYYWNSSSLLPTMKGVTKSSKCRKMIE